MDEEADNENQSKSKTVQNNTSKQISFGEEKTTSNDISKESHCLESENTDEKVSDNDEGTYPSIQVIDNIVETTTESKTNEQFNIVCFGDSITEGAEFPEELRWPSILQGMLDELEPDKFKVHNKGVGNDTTANALDRFERDVVPLLPGIVFIQFGLNDANVYDWAKYSRVSIFEFKKNLREFYRAIFKKHGTCIFIVNHAIGDVRGKQGNRKSYYDNFIPYNDTIRYVAAKLGAPCIDLYEIIRERQINIDYLISFDKMHLTLEGNMKYASWVYEALTGQEYIFKEYD